MWLPVFTHTTLRAYAAACWVSPTLGDIHHLFRRGAEKKHARRACSPECDTPRHPSVARYPFDPYFFKV